MAGDFGATSPNGNVSLLANRDHIGFGIATKTMNSKRSRGTAKRNAIQDRSNVSSLQKPNGHRPLAANFCFWPFSTAHDRVPARPLTAVEQKVIPAFSRSLTLPPSRSTGVAF
jgi:hypothetical protein